MVDLGFLLITFFLFTTTLARPRVMHLSMPYRPKDDRAYIYWKSGQTMTILLAGQHCIYYYSGEGITKTLPATFRQATFTGNNGIRIAIAAHIKAVHELQQTGILDPGNSAAFLVKADTNSTYSDLINVLDEFAINNVAMKAVVEITPLDQHYIRSASALQ
jgi:biopolymer transport protein ExbD